MRAHRIIEPDEQATEAIRRTVAAAIARQGVVGVERSAREIATAGAVPFERVRDELVRACVAARVNMEFGSES